MWDLNDLAEQYIDEVQSGELVSGRLAQLAVQRHVSLLENAEEKGYYFDEKETSRIGAIFSLFKHTSGDYGGKPFGMLPWQAFVLYYVFGWKVKLTGKRLVRKCYVEVAKKNGKTELAAGIGLLGAFFDGEYGAEVYSAANKFDQASICWRSAATMSRFLRSDSKSFSALVDIHGATNNRNIFSKKLNSFFKPVAADSKTLDGLRPNFSIVDEYHEATSDDILRNLSSGMVNRSQPLLFIITTAGFNVQGPCYRYRSVVKDILENKKQDDSTFGVVFALDDDDDWEDENNWVKANPSIGTTPTWEGLRAEYIKAVNEGSSAEVNFKTKNLNEWTKQSKVWIKQDTWRKNCFGFDPDQLIGRKCFGGLDLAKTRDISAFTLLFPPEEENEKYKLICRFWCPGDNIRERSKSDRVPYQDWVNSNHLIATPGDVTDYEYIEAEILELGAKYDIESIGYDSWNATRLATNLEAQNVNMRVFGQWIKDFNEPITWIERNIMLKKVDHLNNPLLEWMVGNVELKFDTNGNKKFDKNKSREKIDGMVAFGMSVGEMLDLYVDADQSFEILWN